MKKTPSLIKSFINYIDDNPNWYIISVTFNNSNFFNKLNSIRELYVRLSNSKSCIVGHPSNRIWWKQLRTNGLYETKIYDETLIFNFIFTTKISVNELEFKSRLKKICPYVSIDFTYLDYEKLDLLKSKKYYSFQQNIQVFGELKKPKVINDLNFDDKTIEFQTKPDVLFLV